jgi:glutathione peroxidase-family protein
MGFPCNEFGAQEPDANSVIEANMKTKFNVAFPLFAKSNVNAPCRVSRAAVLVFEKQIAFIIYCTCKRDTGAGLFNFQGMLLFFHALSFLWILMTH